MTTPPRLGGLTKLYTPFGETPAGIVQRSTFGESIAKEKSSREWPRTDTEEMVNRISMKWDDHTAEEHSTCPTSDQVQKGESIS